MNGDGAADAADGGFAARVGDGAEESIDLGEGRSRLRAALVLLLAGSALAAAGLQARRTVR